MNHEDRDDQIRQLAANTPPITTWQQVVYFVDDPTWDRILGDLAPASRAEALACRPGRKQPELQLVPPTE